MRRFTFGTYYVGAADDGTTAAYGVRAFDAETDPDDGLNVDSANDWEAGHDCVGWMGELVDVYIRPLFRLIVGFGHIAHFQERWVQIKPSRE